MTRFILTAALTALGVLSALPVAAQDAKDKSQPFTIGNSEPVSITESGMVSGCERIAKILSERMQKKELRLAVLEPKDNSLDDEDDYYSVLGRQMADELTNSLSTKITVQQLFDRKATARRLDELKLGNSDLYDANKAKQFGKSLGVDAIIVGNYNVSIAQRSARVIMKVIDVETGKIEATADATFPLTAEEVKKGEAKPVKSEKKTGAKSK